MVNDKWEKLLNYINKPLARETIIDYYTKHNIIYERCELYCDFVLSLVDLIFDTYLGDELMNEAERRNHFKWCWNTTVNRFTKEGIYVDNQKLYKYFLDFMTTVWYSIPKKEYNKLTRNINKLWSDILNYNGNKSKSDIDTLIEVYKLFENSVIFKQKDFIL